MNQDPGKAPVFHKEDWQPISLNKKYVQRQYYRKVKEPELVTLQDVEQTSTPSASLRLTLPRYKDTEDTDPDNLLHCPECGAKWGGNCPLHGFLHFVSDVVVPRHTSNTLRADLTTPYVVNICPLPNGESGVSARMPIPIRTRFGPYEGQIVSLEDASEHAWLIRRNGKPDHCIDAQEPGLSNWMRYVQNAPEKGKENLLAYQYHGNLYYMTIRNIFPGEQLLVWCGSKYKQPQNEEEDSQVAVDIARNIKKEVLDDAGGVREVGRYIKKEVEEVADDAMEDLRSRVFSEDRACNKDIVSRIIVKTEVDDDSYCDGGREKVKRGKSCRVVSDDDRHDQEEVERGIEEMRKKIKLEVGEDRNDTSFIKEEVEWDDAGQSDRTNEVNGSAAEVCDEQDKQSDQDLMELDGANSVEVNNENGTDALEEDAGANGSDDSCSTLPKTIDGAAAAMEERFEDTESIVDLCSDEVSSEVTLDAPRKKSLSCSSCKKSFPCKAKLNRHLQLRHGGEPFECRECKIKFDCKSGLTKHLRSHVEDNSSSRHEPDPQFSPEKLRNRTSRSNAPRFACTHRDCSSRFGTRRAYQNHMLKHKIHMAVNCPKCLKPLGSQANLNFHLQRTVCSYLPYVCSKCRTAFKECAKLKEHSCLVDDDNLTCTVESEDKQVSRPYFCSECNLHFDSTRELHKHFQLSHKPQSSVFCKYCKKMYSTHHVLKKHVRRVHSKEKLFVCNVCNKRFFAGVDLQRHLSIHAESKTYNCEMCNERFDSKDELSKHLPTHKNEISCRLCDRPYNSYTSLQQHIRRKHPGAKLFECSQCQEKFRYHSERERHMEFHARQKRLLEEASDLSLADTPLTFTIFDDLDSEWNVKRNVCPDCKRVFSTDKALFNHVCTIIGREGRFECNKCSKEFSNSFDLERHLSCHQEGRPYLCVECNNDFSCQSLLDKHHCFDNNERPIACSECDRRFWTDAAYKRHLRSHVVDKPHACSECAESFSQPDQLDAHLQTHFRDTPFTCVECDSGLYEKYRLNRHSATQCHEEDTKLTCVQCDRKFSFDSLTERVSQDHRPFEFVSCEPE